VTALLRYLFLVPLAVHLGWLAATWQALPSQMGGAICSPALRVDFLLEWLALTLLANAAFLGLYAWLPKGPARLLSVPNRERWLQTPAGKAQLVAQLRGLIEVSLFCLNLLFLAMYQFIYQGNMPRPHIAFPLPVLYLLFMVAPLAGNIAYIWYVARHLKQGPQAPASSDAPPDEPEASPDEPEASPDEP